MYQSFRDLCKRILNIPTTTNTPTPIAIPPIKITAFIGPGTMVTCFETIKILGSAHVINSPKASENKTTIKMFFCLDKEAPIYSPTLLKEEDAPIWNKASPVIRINIPIRTSQMLELDPLDVIVAKPVKCNTKIIAIIGTIDNEDDINAATCLFLIITSTSY